MTTARTLVICAFCLLCISMMAERSAAQEVSPYSGDEVPRLDWYYASVFGTGRYSAGERTVTAFRIPIGWNLPQGDKAGVTARLLAPVTLGAVDFDLDGVIDDPLDSVSMLMFSPGVEWQIEMGEDWLVRPFANLGVGIELKGDDRAWIYAAGVSARRHLPCAQVQCKLGLALTWAGYNSHQHPADDMSNLSLGLDFVFPASLSGFDRRLHPGTFFIYRNYLSGIDFIFDPLGVDSLDEEWEAGVSLNASQSFSILGIEFDRVGLSYRRGGDLKGVHLSGRFPF